MRLKNKLITATLFFAALAAATVSAAIEALRTGNDTLSTTRSVVASPTNEAVRTDQLCQMAIKMLSASFKTTESSPTTLLTQAQQGALKVAAGALEGIRKAFDDGYVDFDEAISHALADQASSLIRLFPGKVDRKIIAAI